MPASDGPFIDLTEEEEARLPLPDGWVCLIKVPNPGQDQMRVYKNVKLGIEATEHPYILQAQSLLKKVPLPSDWTKRTSTATDGSKEIFYHNFELNYSMWDHPYLREQLCECLLSDGHDPVAYGVKLEKESSDLSNSVSSSHASSGGGKEITKAHHERLRAHAKRKPSLANEDGNVDDEGLSDDEEEGYDGSSRSSSEDDEVGDHSDDEIDDTTNDDQNDSKQYQESMDGGTYGSSDVGDVGDGGDDNSRLYLDDLDSVTADPSPHTGHLTTFEEEDEKEGKETMSMRTGEEESMEVNSTIEPNQHRNWEKLLSSYGERGTAMTDRVSHRVTHIKPPVSISGIRVLRGDVIEANERVHQLVMKLRSMMSYRSGIHCSTHYRDSAPADGLIGTTSVASVAAAGAAASGRSNITLASDIVTALRQRPEFVVMAMVNSNNLKGGREVMVQIAFTALHRLLHPFSSDNSMTTAILLQGINYQLDELAAVEEIFSKWDSRVITSRALFISSPEDVVGWDPLMEPLPCVPDVASETVLACLLRIYAIRRDVTSYFRTIWKPILPGVVALLKHDTKNADGSLQILTHHDQAHHFPNILAVAHRLLECTLSERSIVVFPTIATAVCRAVYEIGGHPALHTYLFQLLVLPNLLKVLAGDHESSENEDIYRVDNIEEIVNKYYDSTFWFNKDGKSERAEESAAEEAKVPAAGSPTEFNGSPNNSPADTVPEEEGAEAILHPLRSLIWLVWRLYTMAVFLDDASLTVLSMEQFLVTSGKLSKDLSATTYPAKRLRSMIMRLRRKIDRGCSFLLQMPMDAQGSEYLGVEGNDADEQMEQLKVNMAAAATPEMAHLIDRRIQMLHFKPNEMLNLTIVSKHEIGALFNDVALAMEIHDEAAHSPVYRAISEYLSLNSQENESAAEEEEEEGDSLQEVLMQLTFLYPSEDFAEDVVGNDTHNNQHIDLIANRYDQLMRGLKLANRYEDSLIKMVQRMEGNSVSNLFELIEDDTWYQAPEFDTVFKSDTVKIATKHTVGSMGKQKGAHFGLKKRLEVQVFPLFSNHAEHDHHPNIKSLKSLQKDVFSSYRFHTAANCANAGTSLARPKVHAPVVHPRHINVTPGNSNSVLNNNSYNNNRIGKTRNDGTVLSRNLSRYTKIEVHADSSLLAPTQSVLNQRRQQEAENPTQKHKKFLKSLREHQVIPTAEFQMRYRQRQHDRRLHEQRKYNSNASNHQHSSNNRLGDSGGSAGTSGGGVGDPTGPTGTGNVSPSYERHTRSRGAALRGPVRRQGNGKDRVVQPFPDHLRSRIRADSPATGEYVEYTQPQEQLYWDAQQQQQQLYFDEDGVPLETMEPDVSYFTGREGTLPLSPSSAAAGADGSYYSDEGQEEEQEDPQEFAQDLIREYSQLFSASRHTAPTATTATTTTAAGRRPSERNARTSSPSRIVPRTRSPAGLPEPIPQTEGTRFQSPTQSTLHRLIADPVTRSPSDLRNYPSATGTAARHAEPFVPTKNRVYPPEGERIPQAPAFLYNEEVSEYSAYSRTASRSTATSRTGTPRSISRSSSPIRNRSRDNSFSNLQHVRYWDTNDPQQQHVESQHAPPPGDLLAAAAAQVAAERRQQEDAEEEEKKAMMNNPLIYTEIDDEHESNDMIHVEYHQQQQAPAPNVEHIHLKKGLQPNTMAHPQSLKQPQSLPQPVFPVDDEDVMSQSSGSDASRSSGSYSRRRVSVSATTVPPTSVPLATAADTTTAGVSHLPLSNQHEPRVQKARAKSVHLGGSGTDPNAFISSLHKPPAQPTATTTLRVNPVAPPPETRARRRRSSMGTGTGTAHAPHPTGNGEPGNASGGGGGGGEGSAYAMQFEPASTAPPGSPHVYNVNQDREEVFQRFYDSIHDGEQEEEEEAGHDEDDFMQRSLSFDRRENASSQPAADSGSAPSEPAAPPSPATTKRSSRIMDKNQLLEILKSGFHAQKHGRAGRPKKRLVRYNEAAGSIEWAGVSSVRLPSLSSMFRRRSASSNPHSQQSSSHGSHDTNTSAGAGHAEERPAAADSTTSSISLQDVQEVLRGVHTEVLLRAGMIDPSCCLSIVTARRSLDLQFANSIERDRVVRGLQILLTSPDLHQPPPHKSVRFA